MNKKKKTVSSIFWFAIKHKIKVVKYFFKGLFQSFSFITKLIICFVYFLVCYIQYSILKQNIFSQIFKNS